MLKKFKPPLKWRQGRNRTRLAFSRNCYGDGNWSDKLTSYDGQTITYDASGNPTSYRGETATWDGRLMTSYTKDGCLYEYEYNSDGMRTIRRMYKNGELASTIRYIWDGDVLLGTRMESVDSDETFLARYLYDDSGELYGMEYKGLENAGSGMFAFIKNLQGDIVSITPLDSESNVEVNMEYDAWGKPIIQQASSMMEGLLMAIMMMVTNVGYRGYFYDLETELYYLRSRYYDPEIGRFINADDTAYLGYNGTPLSLNLFAYCENNPVNCVDNDGKKTIQVRDKNLVLVYMITMVLAIAEQYMRCFKLKPYERDGKKYNTKFVLTIDFTEMDFYKTIYEWYQLIRDKVFEVLAAVACDYFEREKGRPFLYSDECVENEIKEHYLGYMYFSGYSIKPPTVITGFYFIGGIKYVKDYNGFNNFFNSIIERCEAADISEADAILSPTEATGFNYFGGIRKCYMNTKYDPYYINGKRKRSFKNKDWLDMNLRRP